MNHRPLLLAATLAVAVGLSACHKTTPAEEMEKTATAMEKASSEPAKPAAGAPGNGEYDAAQAALVPAKEVKEALSDYKAGKFEDAVTRLQLLRAQPVLSPQQRMALQDSMAAVMTEIYAQAEKGDARAKAAVAQYEKMQTSH
jgi:hypothetical protein